MFRPRQRTGIYNHIFRHFRAIILCNILLVRTFEVVGIVSKPPTPSGRGKKLTKCPVQLYGENAGIPVLTPLKATEEPFLQQLHLMQPDLCITASYGNYLPKKFLAIPKFGTLNIHPSLLPKWRGAAPVQRSLENGDRLVGVTVLFTVQKMDAGPVVTQSAIQLTGDESFPAVLKTLMDIGTDNLLSVLPDLWAGTVHQHEQDEAAVTEAPKFDNSDAFVDFRVLTAREAHNRCRALSGTFGTWCSFEIVDDSLLKIDGSMRVNIISTIVLNEGDGSRNHNGNNKVEVVRNPNPAEKGNILGISCRGGSLLGVTAVQPATKRVMTARDFLNGIKSNKSIFWVGPE